MLKLSILICTLPERAKQYMHMIDLLHVGTRDDVEVICDGRGRHIPTGQKRNELIQQCTGSHFVFCDDDDEVTGDYVEELVKAMQYDPDVITFCGWMTTNGNSRVDWIIKLGEKYEARKDQDGITRYYRWPNHICAFKKSVVQHIKFPHIWQQEDFKWSEEIKNRGLLRTEVHIDKQLYHYKFSTRK